MECIIPIETLMVSLDVPDTYLNTTLPSWDFIETRITASYNIAKRCLPQIFLDVNEAVKTLEESDKTKDNLRSLMFMKDLSVCLSKVLKTDELTQQANEVVDFKESYEKKLVHMSKTRIYNYFNQPEPKPQFEDHGLDINRVDEFVSKYSPFFISYYSAMNQDQDKLFIRYFLRRLYFMEGVVYTKIFNYYSDKVFNECLYQALLKYKEDPVDFFMIARTESFRKADFKHFFVKLNTNENYLSTSMALEEDERDNSVVEKEMECLNNFKKAIKHWKPLVEEETTSSLTMGDLLPIEKSESFNNQHKVLELWYEQLEDDGTLISIAQVEINKPESKNIPQFFYKKTIQENDVLEEGEQSSALDPKNKQKPSSSLTKETVTTTNTDSNLMDKEDRSETSDDYKLSNKNFIIILVLILLLPPLSFVSYYCFDW